MSKIVIVTDSEAGWDCLVSAHESIDRFKEVYNVPLHMNKIYDMQQHIRERDRASYVVFETDLT